MNSEKAKSFCCYDTDSKVYYQVSNDEENLHIKLNTAEPGSMAKILKTGLKIYFDIEGKKNQDVFFQYPIISSQDIPNQKSMKRNGNQSFNFPKQVSEYHKEALFNQYGSVDRFPLLLSNSDIKVSISVNDKRELDYDLIIPFSRIAEGGIPSFSDLSIGIVSGKMNRTSAVNSGQSQARMSGGGKGGGRRGMSGGKRPNNSAKSAMSSPINIWFKVNLQH